MIDPRVLHQITVELAMGFLTLAGVAVALKLVADLWQRRFRGRSWTLDRWSRSLAAFAEPTAFVALALGVFISFATSYTGLNVWPSAMLWSDPTVRNKMLLVALSTTLFLGAFVLRARFRARIWLAPSTGALYAGLVLVGNVILVLQNSVGGHLQGTGSALDDLLAMLQVNETVLWTLPTQVAYACLLGFPLLVILLAANLKVSNRKWARRELVPLARDVKALLAEAQRADIAVDGPRRLIQRANVAARQGHHARAVRLLDRAKAKLFVAPPLSGSLEGIEFWATEELPRPRRRRRLAAEPGHALASASPGSLPEAVGLVESSLRQFEEAPILRLQAELRAARAALLDVRARGWDLREPLRTLHEVRAHLQRTEWNDAVLALQRFRQEMKRVSDEMAGTGVRADRDEPASTDET